MARRASSHPLAHTLLAQARAKRAPRVRLWHFGDIDASRFNARFRAPFGHQSVVRLGRRLTLSGLSQRVFFVWQATSRKGLPVGTCLPPTHILRVTVTTFGVQD